MRAVEPSEDGRNDASDDCDALTNGFDIPVDAAIGSYERVDGTIDLDALFDKALDAFVLENETEKEAGTPAGSRRGAPLAACTPETPGAPGEGVAAGTQPVTPPAALERSPGGKKFFPWLDAPQGSLTVDGNIKQHNRATHKNSLKLPENYPSPPGNEWQRTCAQG